MYFIQSEDANPFFLEIISHSSIVFFPHVGQLNWVKASDKSSVSIRRYPEISLFWAGVSVWKS